MANNTGGEANEVRDATHDIVARVMASGDRDLALCGLVKLLAENAVQTARVADALNALGVQASYGK